MRLFKNNKLVKGALFILCFSLFLTSILMWERIFPHNASGVVTKETPTANTTSSHTQNPSTQGPNDPGYVQSSKNEMEPVFSYAQVKEVIDENEKQLYRNYYDIEDNMAYEEGDMEGAATDSAPTNGGTKDMENGKQSDNADFSQTNTQVKGIDEADVIKTDGSYIYTMDRNAFLVHITKAEDGTLTKTSTIDLNQDAGSKARKAYCWPNEAYLDQNRFIVYCNSNDNNKQSTVILVYDVEDKENPKLLHTLSQDGYYTSSRKSGNYIYTVSSHSVIQPYHTYGIDDYDVRSDDASEQTPSKGVEGEWTEEDYIPHVNERLMGCENIYVSEGCNDNVYTVVTAFDLTNPKDFVSEKSILSGTKDVYVSGDNIYITGVLMKENVNVNQTKIIKMGYKDGKIRKPVYGVVDGVTNNQFSLDEYEGHLRIVTTVYLYNDRDGSNKQYNSLFVLDEGLEVVGRIEDLAPNEQVYSARFMGVHGYFVTFRQVDPLFSVDLSNPKKPKVIGKLKIPGFSKYLHFYNENLMLGIGQEVNPNSGELEGLKLSMFDISDPSDVKEVDKYVMKEYGYSPALNDHKCVMIDTDKNLFGFYASGYHEDYTEMYNDYMLFSYENGFRQNATIHVGDNRSYPPDDVRAVFIKDYVYVYAVGFHMQSYSLETYEKKDQVNY